MQSVPSMTSLVVTSTGSIIARVFRLVTDGRRADQVRKTMSDLFLETDLELIASVACECVAIMESTTHTSVKVALAHLDNSVRVLDETLRELEATLAQHDAKWFSSWRALASDVPLCSVVQAKANVDHHFERLVQVLGLMKSEQT